MKYNKNIQKRILVAIPGHPFSGAERIAGVRRYARLKDDWLVIPVDGSYLSDHFALKSVAPVAGVIWHQLCNASMRKLVRRFKHCPQVMIADMPVALQGRGRGTVTTLNADFGCTIADFLLAKGLSEFAYVGITRKECESLREAAFVERLARAGKSYHCFCVKTDRSVPCDEEQRRLNTWLAALPKPCGLMVAFDELAEIVLDCAARAGISIPHELCVVSVGNNRSVCERSLPPLSSLDPGFFGEGYTAAKLLDELMTGHSEDAAYCPNKGGAIVERLSSEYVANRHDYLLRAREFIRSHLTSRLSVAIIAKHVRVSVRLLAMNFRKVYGRTVNEEIQRQRVEGIAKALTNTTLSIQEICGMYEGMTERQLKNIFKARTGVCMRRWRDGER